MSSKLEAENKFLSPYMYTVDLVIQGRVMIHIWEICKFLPVKASVMIHTFISSSIITLLLQLHIKNHLQKYYFLNID